MVEMDIDQRKLYPKSKQVHDLMGELIGRPYRADITISSPDEEQTNTFKQVSL